MYMSKHVVLAAAIAICQTGFAEDLYDYGGKLRDIKAGAPIVTADTVGGFALYQGGGGWRFERGTSSATSGGILTTSVPLAEFLTFQIVEGEIFQRLAVAATIGKGIGHGWSGTPCSPTHLIAKDKGRGREDHCLTIDPISIQVDNRPVTFLMLSTTNSNGGRYHEQHLMINPNLWGVRDSSPADWAELGLMQSPFRRAILERLKVWGEKFLDASMNAFGFSQPQDSYESLPSLRTLQSGVVDLPEGK